MNSLLFEFKRYVDYFSLFILLSVTRMEGDLKAPSRWIHYWIQGVTTSFSHSYFQYIQQKLFVNILIEDFTLDPKNELLIHEPNFDL
jgi:hypothetical protein